MFVLEKDSGDLEAHSSASEAESSCEGVDVGDGAYLFFADDGSPLEAKFERPNQRGTFAVVSGTYVLQRAVSGLWLQERLAQVKAVDGCGLSTVADLAELLKINRSKRIPPGVKRG